MPKGIPKNQKLVDEMLYRLCKLELREKDSRESQDERIAALEARIVEMNEAFSKAKFPRAPIVAYESVFEKWPGQSTR